MTSATGRVTCDMTVSLDGFAAGPRQSLELAFGEGVGDRLHRWMFEQRGTALVAHVRYRVSKGAGTGFAAGSGR